MSGKTPAWVLRMEKATDAGGYRCSGFEANAVAKEWRENQARIAELEAALEISEAQTEALNEGTLKLEAEVLKLRLELGRARGTICDKEIQEGASDE